MCIRDSHGRNAAGSLDLATAMHALDHQLHIVEVGTGSGEAGAGLDVVRACLADDITHLFLFLVGQQAGLDDDLQDLVAHRLLHGADVLAHGIVPVSYTHLAAGQALAGV